MITITIAGFPNEDRRSVIIKNSNGTLWKEDSIFALENCEKWCETVGIQFESISFSHSSSYGVQMQMATVNHEVNLQIYGDNVFLNLEDTEEIKIDLGDHLNKLIMANILREENKTNIYLPILVSKTGEEAVERAIKDTKDLTVLPINYLEYIPSVINIVRTNY
ncbi:hypothetical protein P9X10_01265 [Bacillus cereus]|nr:hypothetical protein [Bacillus cereus]